MISCCCYKCNVIAMEGCSQLLMGKNSYSMHDLYKKMLSKNVVFECSKS